jgi:hypothetical protein
MPNLANLHRETAPTTRFPLDRLHVAPGNVLRALQIWVLVNRLTQGQVAGSSGCIFGTLSSFVSGVHFAHHQGHLPLLTQGAAMCFKQIGCILQTMVNVHSPHLPRPALNAGPQQSS